MCPLLVTAQWTGDAVAWPDAHRAAHQPSCPKRRGPGAATKEGVAAPLSPGYPRLMHQPTRRIEPADTKRNRALAWVESSEPCGNPRHERGRDLTLELLQRSPDPFDRTDYELGHITASAVVFSPDRARVLLVFHNRLQLWLQPGGHVERSDPDVLAAARREVMEETGAALYAANNPQLVGVDVHDIPPARGEPRHLHHDLVFRLVARREKVQVSSESRSVAWCPVQDLSDYQADDALRGVVDRAIREG